jgi:hypothetical protein
VAVVALARRLQELRVRRVEEEVAPDRAGAATLSSAALRASALAPFAEVTFTCVPPGSGLRVGIDRDLDGTLDGNE